MQSTANAEIGFIRGRTYTTEELHSAMKIKTEGGIRYSGNFPSVRNVSVFVSQTQNAIYGDQISQARWIYTGEGLVGNQSLTRGNRVLVFCHLNGIGINGFEHRMGNWEFLGKFRVVRVDTDLEPDKDGRIRSVLKFALEPETYS